MSDEGAPNNTTVCETCGTAVPPYDVVSYGSIERGYRELCTGCFNAVVASELGAGAIRAGPARASGDDGPRRRAARIPFRD